MFFVFAMTLTHTIDNSEFIFQAAGNLGCDSRTGESRRFSAWVQRTIATEVMYVGMYAYSCRRHHTQFIHNKQSSLWQSLSRRAIAPRPVGAVGLHLLVPSQLRLAHPPERPMIDGNFGQISGAVFSSISGGVLKTDSITDAMRHNSSNSGCQLAEYDAT